MTVLTSSLDVQPTGAPRHQHKLYNCGRPSATRGPHVELRPPLTANADMAPTSVRPPGERVGKNFTTLDWDPQKPMGETITRHHRSTPPSGPVTSQTKPRLHWKYCGSPLRSSNGPALRKLPTSRPNVAAAPHWPEYFCSRISQELFINNHRS